MIKNANMLMIFFYCVKENQDEITRAHQDGSSTSKLRYSVMEANVRIILRKKTKILRYVHYSKNVDSENYYRKQLLFHPWRNKEHDLLNGFKNFKDHFKAIEKRNTIKES